MARGPRAGRPEFPRPEVCVIQGQHCFVRARLVIPVRDGDDFEWGVWVSLSKENFSRMPQVWTTDGRESEPPYFGWLSTELPVYPAPALTLKIRAHTEKVGNRPHVELEPTDHPLVVEQRTGITRQRVQEIAGALLHPPA